MPDFFLFINEILWGSVMIYLLMGAGIWFTVRTGFIQFRYLRHVGKSLKNSVTPQPGGLTSFQALCTSLAARVGSGNLVGVALAISAGGPGAVFWMWVSALIGMATAFAECALAQLYKERDEHNQFRGGPAWYITRGLGMRWMGIVFALLTPSSPTQWSTPCAMPGRYPSCLAGCFWLLPRCWRLCSAFAALPASCSGWSR